MIEITGKRNAARQSSKRPERQTDREARGLSPLGSSASARLLRLLRARLAALAGSALPGERPARWVASGARAGRLLSRRFPLNFPRSSTTQATTRRTSASGRRTRAWRGSRRRVGGRTPHSFVLPRAFFLSFPLFFVSVLSPARPRSLSDAGSTDVRAAAEQLGQLDQAHADQAGYVRVVRGLRVQARWYRARPASPQSSIEHAGHTGVP
jgi:hypothetical protein